MKPKLASQFALFLGLIAPALIPASAQAGIISTANAISFWAFDQTVVSSDGRGATYAGGSSSSPDFVADRFGNASSALSLRGETDVLNVDDLAIARNLTDFSISVWFRMDNHNPNGGRSTLFDTRVSGVSYNNNGEASVIGLIDNGIEPASGNNPSDGYFATFNSQDIELSNVNNGGWHNIFFSVSEGSNQSIYYNGINISNGPPNPTGPSPSTFDRGLTFGDTGIDAGGRGFNLRGDLDDIAIWDRSFAAADVRTFYLQSTSVPLPGSGVLMLLGLYPLLRSRKPS